MKTISIHLVGIPETANRVHVKAATFEKKWLRICRTFEEVKSPQIKEAKVMSRINKIQVICA